MAEVINAQVGSHATENYVRALFLEAGAEEFTAQLANIPNATPQDISNVSLSQANQAITDCGTTLSAFSCISDLAAIEANFASSQAKHDACAFDRHVYLPSYSDIQAWATKTGPYNDAQWQSDAAAMAMPSAKGSLDNGIMALHDYQSLSQRPFNKIVDIVLAVPPGC